MKRVFSGGQRVRVKAWYPPGHVRTPYFVRGRCGEVLECLGYFANPEERAYGRSGLPAKALYRVRFRQCDLWPEYTAHGSDGLIVDIYEHWLEAGPESTQ